MESPWQFGVQAGRAVHVRRWASPTRAQVGAPRSLALQAVVGMAAMVPDDEDAHTIAHNSK